MTEDRVAALTEEIGWLKDCCLHLEVVPTPTLVIGEDHIDHQDYADTDGIWLFKGKMPDAEVEQFFVLMEQGDTTGHGCQCSSTLTKFDTLADALEIGLTKDERERLKL